MSAKKKSRATGQRKTGVGDPIVAPSGGSSAPKMLIRALVIAVAGLFIYGPVLRGDWLWDDYTLVVGNLQLRTWQGLWDIWFAAPASDYWPLTWTLLWVEWHLWGAHPLGYHVCSFAFHLCSAFLIWRLLYRLGLRHGWLGALLFVVHPLAVESVAWISEIKNTLSLPFYLLAIDAWMDRESEKSRARLFAIARSVAFYFVAMLAKTSVIMLPAVLLLYCWWKRGRVTRSELVAMIPYAVIAVGLGLVTVHFQDPALNQNSAAVGGVFARFVESGTAFFFYLGKFFLPIGLMPIYPRWSIDPPSVLQMLSIPAFACLFIIVWVQRKTWGHHALFALGFFLLNLLPVLGLVRMSYMNFSWVADHLVYLPMIGLIGGVVAGWGWAHEKVTGAERGVSLGLLGLVIVLLAGQSSGYAALFINQETLWGYTLERNPAGWPAENNLGFALQVEGKIGEAIAHYQRALELQPQNVQAEINIGTALYQQGKLDEAIPHYQHAVQIDPGNAQARYNLGRALLDKGRVDEAIGFFQDALNIDPDYAVAENGLGLAYGQKGQVDDAMMHYQRATQIDPDFAEPENNLGNALLGKGRNDEAISHFLRALQIEPRSAAIECDLGVALFQVGRVDDAIAHFQKALEIDPNYVSAQTNLAKVQGWKKAQGK